MSEHRPRLKILARLNTKSSTVSDREMIPEWILRHDETLGRYPALIREAKQLKSVLLNVFGVPYRHIVTAQDQLFNEANAQEIHWCEQTLGIPTIDAIARVSAHQAVITEASALSSLINHSEFWKLNLQAALFTMDSEGAHDQLTLAWIDTARRQVWRRRPTAVLHVGRSCTRQELYEAFDSINLDQFKGRYA